MTFEEALRAHGLRPTRSVVPDGRVHRCPTETHPRRRNGAYMLATDGRFGFFRDWARDETPIIWRADSRDTSVAAIDWRAERARRREARRQKWLASRAARKFWESCRELRGGHPYLLAHGLDMTGCRGLRVDDEGWLVVPAWIDGRLSSVQRISPSGDKRFWSGATMTAARYVIDRRGAMYTVLCEGLATGLAIYASSELVRVVVCFYASNMVKVAARYRWTGWVCVAADNDHGTEARIGRNPGVEAARQAAELIGCRVMVPTGIDGTDWCDYVQETVKKRAKAPVRGRRRPSEYAVRRSVMQEVFREVQRASEYKGVL